MNQAISSPPLLSELRSIADSYGVLFCDAWGVIHNGVDVFPGVSEALQAFRDQGGRVIILTNAPRPSSIIPAQLKRIGLPDTCWDDIVTSGDAVRHAIETRLPGTIFRLGPEKDDPLFEDLDAVFARLEEADFIVCTGPIDDERDQPNDYRDLLKEAATHRLPMICANPDHIVRWGDRLIYCAGALAAVYEEVGGQVIHAGKPHGPIYERAMSCAKAFVPDISKSRILAIGDGLQTDILGANRFGIDAIYVAGEGGIHSGARDAEAIAKSLVDAKVHAVGAMVGLAW